MPGTTGGVSALPTVYVNGIYVGNVDVLTSILLDEVQDIRFIKAWQARHWWGPACPCAGGVIHVRTKRAG